MPEDWPHGLPNPIPKGALLMFDKDSNEIPEGWEHVETVSMEYETPHHSASHSRPPKQVLTFKLIRKT